MDEDSICVNYCASFGDDSKTKWTEVMVAKLIDMYRDRRILYDAQIPSNVEQRNADIHQIASELGVSGLFMFLLELVMQ